MWRNTILLLRLYWKLDRRQGDGVPRWARLFGFLFLFFGAAVSGFFGFMVGQWVTQVAAPFVLQEKAVPGLLLTMLLMALLFVGFNQAMRALYMSGDMERLMTAPIHPRAVLSAKLLSRLPTTLLILALLTFPALIAFGIALGLGTLYYIIGILLLLVSPLFGLSIGALISILLVRVLPVNKLEEYMGAAYIVIGMLIALGLQLPNLMRGRGSEANSNSLEAVQVMISSLETMPFPTLWAGSGLVDLGQGQFTAAALGGILAYLLITVGLFAVTMLLASTLYLSGWLRIQGAGDSKRGLDEASDFFSDRSLASILMVKDWLLRLRDSRQVATLFTQLGAGIFFAFIILRPGDGNSLLYIGSSGGPDTGFTPELIFSRGVVVSAAVLYINYLAFSQVALNSLGLEGQSFYILKSAPIGPRQVYKSKTWGTLAPYGFLSTILLIAGWIILRFSLIWAPYAWLSLLIMGYGLLSFATSIGFTNVNLNWTDVRKMSTGKGRLFSLLGAVAYGLLGGILLIIFFILGVSAPSAALLTMIAGLLLLGIVTWLFVRWATIRAVNAWPALGETQI